VPLIRRARETIAEVRSIENPQYPLTSSALVELFTGRRTDSGVYINELNAQRIVAVYRAHALLGGTIGSLPLRSFTGEAPGGSRWAGRESKLLLHPGGIDDRGNPLEGTPTAVVFYETMIVHLLSWGNAYIVKHRDNAGRVSMLDLLLPNMVSPRWVKRTAANPAGKEFWVIGSDGFVSIATPKDVIHIPAMGQSLLQGISPIGAARQALGLAVAAEEYGARLFGSGNLMSGILTTDARLRQGDAEKLRDRWREKMNGLSNAYDVAVMDAGAKWQSIGIPPEDSQFIQTREFAVTEIARLYGIPPHMLGQINTSTSWGTGIEQQSIGFNTYTLRPWLTRTEQGLSNALLPFSVNARFNVAELLRGDMKNEVDAHQVAIMSGQETLNEARRARGLPDMPDADELLFPINYTTVGNLTKPPPAPLPAPTPPNGTGGSAK
jgi:HK97 family phage portal protein